MTRPRWPLTLLMIALIAWQPAAFALYASAIVDRVVERGPLAVTVLVAKMAVTAAGIGAGLALWNDQPWAVPFARLAVLLSAAATILDTTTRALPNNAPPGLAGPLLAATLAWDAGWIAYLTWRLRRP